MQMNDDRDFGLIEGLIYAIPIGIISWVIIILTILYWL